jgi:hypothetical protein
MLDVSSSVTQKWGLSFIRRLLLKVEFLNLNDDSKLDPEIKKIPLSKDSKNKPPAYCLPWVEAARFSIQIKSNENYLIRKTSKGIEAWVQRGGKKIPFASYYLKVPEGMSFVPRDPSEHFEKKIRVSYTPAFSSPWQKKQAHSITLKTGICWWTPPGWGLFVISAVHRNEGFRIVEGMVRTDLWHRDIPILVQPLQGEIKIPKYSILASALLVAAEDPELQGLKKSEEKVRELIGQINLKRTNPSIYKKLVLPRKIYENLLPQKGRKK